MTLLPSVLLVNHSDVISQMPSGPPPPPTDGRGTPSVALLTDEQG